MSSATPDLTPRMWKVLTDTAKKSLWSRNPAKSGERAVKFGRPFDGHDCRSAMALAKRGMLEEQTFSVRTGSVGLTSRYERLPHWRVTDAGWEAVVEHRGWRDFVRDQQSGNYVVTRPNNSVLVVLSKGEKKGWVLLPSGKEAPRLSDALMMALE